MSMISVVQLASLNQPDPRDVRIAELEGEVARLEKSSEMSAGMVRNALATIAVQEAEVEQYRGNAVCADAERVRAREAWEAIAKSNEALLAEVANLARAVRMLCAIAATHNEGPALGYGMPLADSEYFDLSDGDLAEAIYAVAKYLEPAPTTPKEKS